MSLIEIKVPDIGDFSEVAVIELLVKPGDTIKAEQSLITVESDKASMEIPSSHAGVVKELKVKLGDKVAMLKRLRRRLQPASVAQRTWSATCWCSAAALAATRRRSARRTWA